MWEGSAEELHLLVVYVHFLRLGDMCSSLQRDPWQCRAGALSAIWIFIYFFLKQGNLSFFPCVFCAHFVFNADTQFTFLAPRTLSAPHSEVCKGHFVFSDHISIHRPPPGSVPLPGFCLCKDYFLCCHGINVTVTA